MVIAGGYDLIREDNLEGGSLNKSFDPHAGKFTAARTSIADACQQYLCRY